MKEVISQQYFEILTQGIRFGAECRILKDLSAFLIEVPVPENINLPDPIFNDNEVFLQANAFSGLQSFFIQECKNALSFPPQQTILLLKSRKSPFTIIYKDEEIKLVRIKLDRFGDGFLPEGLELVSSEWTARFQKSRNTDEKYEIEFRPIDDYSFSRETADAAIEALWHFLSFCQGHRIGLSDAAMLASDSCLVARKFGSTAQRRNGNFDSWFYDGLAQSLPALFSTYSLLSESSSDWNKTLHEVLYWINRANVEEVGSDGALILLQVALERLAWQVLAIAPGLSAAEQEKLDKTSAAYRINLLLTTLNIPSAIPIALEGLRQATPTPDDGPGTLTRLRNDLIHPARQSLVVRSNDRYYASELARWYLELSILSLCHYQGKYCNRTNLPRWSGATVDVPWA